MMWEKALDLEVGLELAVSRSKQFCMEKSMKNKLFWLAAAFLAVLLAFSGCSSPSGSDESQNPANAGILTINNLPSGADYAVGVYNHSGTIGDLLEWASVAANIIAAGTGTASSSMTLYAANTSDVFSGSGTYMVALYTATTPITLLYKTGVSFSNGCATVDYNEMVDLSGNSPDPNAGNKGKLTVNNFPSGASFAITVYNTNIKVESMLDITDVLAQASSKTLASSVGMAASSPVSLVKYSNPLSAFDGTGTYLVLLARISPIGTYFADQVSFTDGCAEIDFSALGLTSDLPLTPTGVSGGRFEYFWVDEHGSLATTSGGNTTIAQGEILTITAGAVGYTVVEWRLNGVSTGTAGDTYDFSSMVSGKYNISLFVSKGGNLYNTNITITVQ